MRKAILTLLITAVIWRTHNSQALTTSNSQTTSYIYVSGSVHGPGRYCWHQGMTITDVINAANGFKNSNAHRITILHLDGREILVECPSLPSPVDKTPVVRQGDSLYVSDLKRIF